MATSDARHAGQAAPGDGPAGTGRRVPRWAWAAAGLATLVALAAVVAWGRGYDPAPPSAPTRDQLRAELVGKTDDDVIARLGHARLIDIGDPAHPVWTYRRATRDPATGHYDRQTYVDFEHNIVADVRT